MKLEDVYYTENGSKFANHYVLDGNVAMSNIGFNVGYETTRTYGSGTTVCLEAGIMPSAKVGAKKNFYLNFKWGFIIGKSFVKS